MTGKRTSIRTIKAKKKRNERIVALTAYDYTTAVLEERAGIDLILVGDSYSMTVMGDKTTLTASLEHMLAITRAVVKGAPDTLVVGDMPFGSYECSDAQAVQTAVRFLSEGGAGAVKLEGGNERSASRVKAIVDSGIPVMGHTGLLPQSVRQTGGFRIVYGDQRERILSESISLQKAGAFSIVLEGVEEKLAREITQALEIPTIGIGAGRFTDGQILVVNDMLGLTQDFEPKFVRKYADLGGIILDAVREYADDVRNGSFPGEEHVYSGRSRVEEK
jgi:3-methyl-2-oxobutanoate hydroxymethyltransferase